MSPKNGAMTEKELRQSLVHAAKTFGWRVYFTWSSMHSPKGFPDLVLLKPPRIIFAELKTEIGKVTPAQQEWLDDLLRLTTGCADVLQTYRTYMGGDPVGFIANERGDQAKALHLALGTMPQVEVYVWKPAQLDEAYAVLMRP